MDNKKLKEWLSTIENYDENLGVCCSTCKHHTYICDGQYSICYEDKSKPNGKQVYEFAICKNWESLWE